MKNYLNKIFPDKVFLIKALMILIVIAGSMQYILNNYRIGFDGQEVRCLIDHKYFLVHLNKKEPVRDQITAYTSIGLSPHFEDGTMMAKIMTGMPGDLVEINEVGVFVNGEVKVLGFALADVQLPPKETFFTSYTIPDDHYLMLAPSPTSYDGRYWGLITKDQIVGKATPFL